VDVVLRPRVENARRAFLHALAASVGREAQFFPPDTNPVYNRHSFNEYGDVVSHKGRKGLDPDSIYVHPLPPIHDFNRKTLDDLNAIEAQARDVKAHAYFMFPSYIDRSYVINVAAIDSLSKRIRGGLDMPVIGAPRDFVYPKDYFFDTRYHLRWDARQVRTRKMIEELRSAGIRDRWLPRNYAMALQGLGGLTTTVRSTPLRMSAATTSGSN
jgi:hypothetical protein